MKKLNKKELMKEARRLKKMSNEMKKCECGCGHPAQVLHTDLYNGTTYFLCKNCEVPFVLCALTPKQFFALIENGHTTWEFMLHEDFYDEKTGKALQSGYD